MTLETKRLKLRPFKHGDEKDIYEYLKHPSTNCFMDLKLDSLKHASLAVNERIRDDLYYAIELKETGKVIGEIFSCPEPAMQNSDILDNYSPCWILSPEYHGQGYGYEAAHAYIDYLFKERNARRIYIYTEDTNIVCQKLCEKLGARKEGCFLEYVSFVNDEEGNPIYENTIQYAILKKEWK